jgi:hypothetical protein
MRHRWFSVEEDLRQSVLDKRPFIHRCRVCGIYRWVYPTIKETRYGIPYKHSVKHAPECVAIKGEHQWLADSKE